MAHSVIFAGLDVHAAQTHAAQLEAATGELSVTRLAGGTDPAVAWLRRLGPGVRAVYEAGPTGFGLARAARQVGIDLRVTTPALIPKRPTDRVKTDRRDAVRLARLLAAGELRFARVPTVAEEQFRDLVRARDDVRGDLMRARHRLSKLLLRREIVYPGPGGAWTQAHMAWLARLGFDDAASTITLADYLAAVEALVQRRTTLDAAIVELVATSPYAATVPVLRWLPRDRHAVGGGVVRRDRRLRPLHPSPAVGRVPGDHTVGAHQRPDPPPRGDHQGRPRPCAAAAGRGRPPLPATSPRRGDPPASAGRRRPARVRGRLARPTAAVPPVAAAARPAWQARWRRHRRMRA